MMKTFLKVFAGIVLLIMVAVVGFVYTFDANNYKLEIASVAEAITGRSMTIGGDMEISLYPWIGVKIHDVTIENPAGFSNSTFATIGQFDVSIKIMPLLQKRLEIDRLVLHGLEADFEKNSAGQYNWKDVSADLEGESVTSRYGLDGLVVGGIDIKDSSLSWLDTNSGKQFRISRLSLATDAINHGQSLPVELKAYVESHQPDWQAAVKATAKLDFSGGQEIFNADDLKLVVKALLPGHKMGTFSFAMVADSAINVRTHTAKLTNARLSTLGQVISGTFDVEDIFSVPVIQGALKVKKFDLEKLAKHIKFDMPRMAEAHALKDISLTASFRTDFTTVQLDDISANVDQSRVTGFVHLATTPDTSVRYDLAIDTLDLDNYRLAEDTSAQDETRLPEFVRTASLEGVLAIQSVAMSDKQYDNVHIASVIDNGILKANPISMVVDQGEVRAALQFDARQDPNTALVAHLKNMDADHTINPLLHDMLGNDSLVLEGRFNADVDLKASGASVAALKTSVQGNITVSMDKATVRGVDFDHASRAVVLDYAKRNDFRVSRTFKTAYDADSATEFSGLNATFRVDRGKLHNNDLSMVSDPVNVTGSGSFDFIKGKLDYRPVIDMNVSNTANIRDKLRDHPMQYHARGQSGKVTCEFDVDKFELWVGRLMIQEAKAHRNRRINSQSEDSWTNVLSN